MNTTTYPKLATDENLSLRIGRDEAIARIRKALKLRTGRAWSVTCDRGTASGWITINAPPSRRRWVNVPTGEKDSLGHDVYRLEYKADAEFGYMSHADRETLRKVLNLHKPAHCQGVSIPASNGHYVEYVDRAEGREPRRYGEKYWD